MNISDIARLANVSPATVSRIINQSGYVSKESRQKVMRIIQENNYTPNSAGRNLRRAKTNLILAMFPDLSNSFFSDVLDGMEKRAAEQNYGLLIAKTRFSKEAETRYLRMLTSKIVDGCIPFSLTLGEAEMDALCEEFPLVSLGECCYSRYASSVVIDDAAAAYDAIRFFLSKGHRRIAYLRNRNSPHASSNRESGYKKALAEANIAFIPRLSQSCEHNHFSAYSACKEMMMTDAPPTAIFCDSDELASGAIHCCADLGKPAGEEIDVFGFDDTSLAEAYLPSISSIALPRFDIGATAVDLLIEKINDISCTCKKVVLPYKLVFRSSAH